MLSEPAPAIIRCCRSSRYNFLQRTSQRRDRHNNSFYFCFNTQSFLSLFLILSFYIFISVIPYDKILRNPLLAVVTTKYGGHLTWLEGVFPTYKRFPHRVFEQYTDLFFASPDNVHLLQNGTTMKTHIVENTVTFPRREFPFDSFHCHTVLKNRVKTPVYLRPKLVFRTVLKNRVKTPYLRPKLAGAKDVSSGLFSC